MIRVVIESPFAANAAFGLTLEGNAAYLRRALRDSLLRGEAPFASHALYTLPGVLDDGIAHERTMGIEAGFAWWDAAEEVIFYLDLGLSSGMQAALERAVRLKKPYVKRWIDRSPAE